MSKMRKIRNLRVRHQNNQANKFGKKAKPRHNLIAGRTGGVLSHRLKNHKNRKDT